MNRRKESLDYIIHHKKISVVFQPIISLKSGIVLGYEALSRITCESEFKNPEMLFTAAEEYNRLWDLELLCRTKALEAAHIFMVSPYNKKLFMNVNPNIMHDDAFKRGFTKNFLKQYGIAPNNVIFEITEKNVIEDMVGFKTTISHYKSQDYKIAIDDAGAGYSGLNLISDVNPNYIKLDMKLIRDIHADNLKNALVKGMVEFSKASNVQLIAEGIETIEELKAIINLGVQYGQGYYLQRPAPEIIEIPQEIIASIREINSQLDQAAQDSVDHSSIRRLCTVGESLPPDAPVRYAYDMIKNTNCFGFCVIDNHIPVGIITKEKLLLALSGQYEFMFNQNRPVSAIMDKDFLSVDSHTPVNIVSSLAMARTNDRLYDFIVVTENNRYLGTVTVKKLLQTTIETDTTMAKQQQHPPADNLPDNLLINSNL